MPLDDDSAPQVICVGDQTECDCEAGTVTEGKQLCMDGVLDVEAFYFWLRGSIIYDKDFSIDPKMYLDIESGSLIVQ